MDDVKKKNLKKASEHGIQAPLALLGVYRGKKWMM